MHFKEQNKRLLIQYFFKKILLVIALKIIQRWKIRPK